MSLVPDKNQSLSFIDLFAGAGGLSEGFKASEYVLPSEIRDNNTELDFDYFSEE